jgi:hypothetical protein
MHMLKKDLLEYCKLRIEQTNHAGVKCLKNTIWEKPVLRFLKTASVKLRNQIRLYSNETTAYLGQMEPICIKVSDVLV